jgi:hypothetical protein
VFDGKGVLADSRAQPRWRGDVARGLHGSLADPLDAGVGVSLTNTQLQRNA